MCKNVKNKIRIAIYLRLSRPDKTLNCDDNQIQKESNSIFMQRILIHSYIDSHFASSDITEYEDDGFSGTHFNRPGIQKLLNDAKSNKIDCIIVKDISRFGRDYLEVGSYLEQIFPFLGIRFISINDHYDSNNYQYNSPDLNVNFKMLLYDLYSKDLSQKVRTSLLAKKDLGQFINGNVPFGYDKCKNDRHMLVICQDEAAIIRQIFYFARQGMTSSQIAKKLNTENVPTPIEFKIKKGQTSRTPKGGRFYWSSNSIYHILRNPVYTGDMEYNKTEKECVGGRNILKPKTDWKIIKNHHVPIITREVFENVQNCISANCKKRKPAEKRHALTGKLICGCCKRNLRLKKGMNPYFTCHNRYVTGLDSCINKVNAMFLEQVVLFQANKWIRETRPDILTSESSPTLTLETVVQYIGKITIHNEEKIEIEWKT